MDAGTSGQKRPKITRGVGVVVTTLALGLTAACASSGSETSGESAGLRFMYNLTPTGLFADYYRTQEQGYYDDSEVDVEIMQGKGSALAIEAVATGNADIADASCATMMLAVAEGRPLVSVGMRFAEPSFGFFVDDESEYQSISDLAGADLLLAPGTVQASLVPFIFEQAGIDFAKDINALGVQPAQQLSVYAQGKGDSIVTSVPYGAPVIEGDRPSRYLMWSDVGFNAPDFCFVANKDFVDENPEAVKGFLEATYKGRVEAFANSEETVNAIMEEFPELNRDVVMGQLMRSENLDCSGDMTRLGMHDEKAWADGVQIMRDHASLDPAIDPGDLYTNEFIDEIDTPECG